MQEFEKTLRANDALVTAAQKDDVLDSTLDKFQKGEFDKMSTKESAFMSDLVVAAAIYRGKEVRHNKSPREIN